MSNNSTNFKSLERDIIGVGVDGSGNIIGKNISVVINEKRTFGLHLLPNNYFETHKSTCEDLNDWKNGFPFKLEGGQYRSTILMQVHGTKDPVTW